MDSILTIFIAYNWHSIIATSYKQIWNKFEVLYILKNLRFILERDICPVII